MGRFGGGWVGLQVGCDGDRQIGGGGSDVRIRWWIGWAVDGFRWMGRQWGGWWL